MTNAVIGGASAASPGDLETAAALRLAHLSKDFSGTRALDDVSLVVRPGTVHALLGGNGSGKSTTIKILAGVYSADAGELEIFGQPFDLQHGYTPTTAQAAGTRFVHQDLGLFEDLSIEENFALDNGYPRRGPGIDWRTLRRRVNALLGEYELDARAETPVRELRPSDRTMVAIARALQDQDEDNRRVLVLDEPTARLAAHESEVLLQRVRRRAELGQTVVIVSHRLREVLAVADDFTIYRDGRVAGTIVDDSPTEDELIQTMAGRAVKALRPTGEASSGDRAPVFSVSGLRGGPLRGIDFTVHRGEILGLAGLVGSGRSSILKVIFGEHAAEAGSMDFDGTPYRPKNIGDAMAAGIGLVPEDRAGEAAFLERTVSENLAIGTLTDNWTHGFMPRGRERRRATDLIRSFGVKVAGPDALFSAMSGGNQQKVVIARWMQRKPTLLLLDEPTQGVDVMSRADIYDIIRRAAADGCAVVVASSDLAEIHALCDRTLVLSRGEISDEVLAGELDVDGLTSLVLREKKMNDASTETRS
ncbi:ribose import ATP-binding protein RbsA [Tersicoccus solisilvae]|uniref:Ribose import ATP-binding protein RbsA n=1 Tax=Tersicoccus solisilvae TaxID=1882339 RepID=A0ABQ1NSX4_9MICC|nr:sugar ABC transporter ATP-binding protein [Tersicoccus solisilvae]GGC84558.1 ribose import ATP-binding protein RbsA [Tersicoccus solisilvae]